MEDLAAGAIALTGLFNNAVECFEFIQLGRTSGKNFQTSQLKLDTARLRLSRWGYSLGLNDKMGDDRSLHKIMGSHQNIHQAEALLGQILELFAEAEGASNKFRSRTKAGDSSLAIYDPQTDLEPAISDLHGRMRQLSIERQNRASVSQKAKCALYEEKHFRSLIEDVTGLVDALVALFPASQTLQHRLCDVEVSAMRKNETLLVLREIASELDKFLERALAKVVGDAKASYSINFSGNNNSGFQLGHNSGSISGFVFGKTA